MFCFSFCELIYVKCICWFELLCFTDVCGYLVSVYESDMDVESGWFGRVVNVLLEDNGVLAVGWVLFLCLYVYDD